MAQYGEIDQSTIMRDPTGRSRGFAFLTYRDPASVTKVMSQSHHLDGKQVSRVALPLSFGFPKAEVLHPPPPARPVPFPRFPNPQIDPKRAIPRAEHERTAKVFVGGLAPAVTSESLKVFLSQFGGVMDATVMFDRETGRSKGFAFATFADEESVGQAMGATGIELEGKQVGQADLFSSHLLGLLGM